MKFKSSALVGIVLSFFGLYLLNSCKDEQVKNQHKLEKGTYRAVLDVMDDKELPFIFKVIDDSTIEVYNADETIVVTDVSYINDSIYIKMPAFEGYIAAKFDEDGLNGSFIKESVDRVVPFHASADNTARFLDVGDAKFKIDGSWEAIFSKGVEGDEYIAKGIFKQNGSQVTGTFRTTTGDYRYLEGKLSGDILKLSTFDGAHAFLFEATVTDSTMNGVFYSGNHWQEPFEAIRNDAYELPSANELTFLNDGYDSLEFTFPDLEGNPISLNDEQFKEKVVIVQIMGSWCPNCLDESKYYTEYYNKNKPANVEIVALAFEYAKTQEKAIASLERLKVNAHIPYPILLAQVGTSSKEEAQKKLPMLNHVLSYPTTIFIDKKGKVRKIHTGFNGPATGDKYVEFKKEFTDFVAKLAAE